MTLQLRELNIYDALYVCSRLPLAEIEVCEAMDGNPYNAEAVAMAVMQFPGMHWVTVDHDDTLAIGGFIRQRSGVFRTWFFATQAAWDTHGREMTDLVKSVIERMLADKLAHRIETVTLADRRRACVWYKQIGLRFESTLRGYCANGADAVMYVATRDREE